MKGGMDLLRELLIFWSSAVNLLAFALCGLDKLAAKRGARRVPERRLLTFCVLGGSPAFLLGMALFHHKTRKPKFYVGVPLILVAQLTLLVLALRFL